MTVQCAALQTDFYKTGHKSFLNKSIEFMNSNFTSRSNKWSNVPDSEYVVWVGLQYYIMDYLINEWNHTFFNIPKEMALRIIKRICDNSLDLDYNVDHFSELHDLGYMPLELRALPEGTLVPYGVAPVVIENTVAGFDWLVNYQETPMSCEIWGINTSATTALAFLRKTIDTFNICGVPTEMAPYMIHDFSMRGMFGRHAAAMSGFGVLASGVVGTDTIPAILFAESYYGADVETEVVGKSVKANEHSVVTSDIAILAETMKDLSTDDARFEAEMQFVTRFLLENPTGIISHVIDSFDAERFMSEGLPRLKPLIMAREGTFVCRPDTGNPVDMVAGSIVTVNIDDPTLESVDDVHKSVIPIIQKIVDLYPENGRDFPESVFMYCSCRAQTYKVVAYPTSKGSIDASISTITPVELTTLEKGLVQIQKEIFGSTTTDKGYELVDSHIGSIYGDSITLSIQDDIHKRLLYKGICPTTVLGKGAFTYQHVTRDTHGSAVKATNVTLGAGKEVAVCKEPKTDLKKKSARGLTIVVRNDEGNLVQLDNISRERYNSGEDLRKVVFKDGTMYNKTTLRNIRELISTQI